VSKCPLDDTETTIYDHPLVRKKSKVVENWTHPHQLGRGQMVDVHRWVFKWDKTQLLWLKKYKVLGILNSTSRVTSKRSIY